MIVQLISHAGILLALTDDGTVLQWNPNINEFAEWGKE
jgi:hypothetical protein